MKYTLLSLLLASTLLSAKTDMADIFFHTSYTESKETTFEQKKGQSIYRLLFTYTLSAS